MKEKRKGIISIIILQSINILFSLAGVAVKITSLFWREYGILSKEVLLGFITIFFMMGLYAFFWQKILAKISLNTAYFNKGTIIIWTLLWSRIFFDEKITVTNIIGALLVIAGVLMVNTNE